MTQALAVPRCLRHHAERAETVTNVAGGAARKHSPQRPLMPTPVAMSHAHGTIEYHARLERDCGALKSLPISKVDQSLTADAWFDKKEDEAHAQRI